MNGQQHILVGLPSKYGTLFQIILLKNVGLEPPTYAPATVTSVNTDTPDTR